MKRLIARLRRRYEIFKAILEQGNQIEADFPQAAMIGIGFNAIWWAAIEQQIDLFIFWHANTRYGELREDHPRALTAKLDYLKKHIERDETLEISFREQVKKFRLELAGLSQRRHDFTHSLMNIEDPKADWSFTRLRYRGKNLEAVHMTYNIEDLQNLTTEILSKFDDVVAIIREHGHDWLIANRNLLSSSSDAKPRP